MDPLRDGVYDFITAIDQQRARRRCGSEQAARAWAASLWQTASNYSARATLREGYSWLQGGHAVVGLAQERGGLLAAAAAAATAGDAYTADTLRLVEKMLGKTLVPAAEWSAGMEVDMASNNG